MAITPQTDELAHKLFKRYQFLAEQRRTWETEWQEIAEILLPGHAEFQFEWTKGQDRTAKQFDSTPQIALRLLG